MRTGGLFAMAYVPGFQNDVFISYCHDDNISDFEDERGWISDFSLGLQRRLKKLLGAPVKVWRDERKLSGEYVFDNEIKTQIEDSAVFLAVVSPLYLNASYCTKERAWFLEKVGDELLIGNRIRGLRVVKTPKFDEFRRELHREVFAQGLGFEFFRQQEDDDVEEFLPASAAFNDQFSKTCRGIKGLLETLRRDRVPVTSPSAHRAFKKSEKRSWRK